ncbi:hypothetical protein ACWGI8_36680 [Streptomyces sp. NPDC054841]
MNATHGRDRKYVERPDLVITGYHVLRAFAPAHMRTQEPLPAAGTSAYDSGGDAGGGGQPVAKS